ncbi:hypothetical protein B9G69_001125 [Bdellovibrio sp. SKB1291214]|uniref:hypothetical protein n=1 Tax=Bdellovibrio sp. SKB1291214 TaxID=1732569 RepID=UPI001131F1EF|nr:hypothetical protein [Bdellovibrio sp. SKB1291214]UYL09177.1 hypothetical protein B9G69_001125 [Bdellovibrio sp. SKB1291214]
MDKISGILPASPRTRMAETAAAQPARPGAPEFGRPQGKNSLGDRIQLSKQMEEMRQSGQLPQPEAPISYKTPEMSKKKVIEDLNKAFFTNPKTIARENADVTRSEEALENTTNAQEFFPTRSNSSTQPGSHGLPASTVDKPL